MRPLILLWLFIPLVLCQNNTIIEPTQPPAQPEPPIDVPQPQPPIDVPQPQPQPSQSQPPQPQPQPSQPQPPPSSTQVSRPTSTSISPSPDNSEPDWKPAIYAIAIIIGIAILFGSVIWCAAKYKRYRNKRRNNNNSLDEIFRNQTQWRTNYPRHF